MSPIALVLCILTTKFPFFFNDVWIKKSFKWKKKTQIPWGGHKIIFRPQHAEDFSYVYVVHCKSNIWACFRLFWETKTPTHGIGFVCISSCSIDKKKKKRLHIAVFLLIKGKVKKHVRHSSFLMCYWKKRITFY